MMQIGMRLGFPWINQNTKCPTRLFNFADGTNVLSPSINFSRTTNATVTNSAGQITYAPHNLLTFSEQFDNAAITKVRATVTSNNTTAPNGTITADKLVEDSTAANTHACYFTATTLAASYVFSVDVKASERNWIVLGHSGKTAFFNVATGILGNVDAGATATITASANGFYRCTLAATATAGSTLALIYLATANGTNSYNGDGTSGVYVWGAQLEVGASPTTYNSTTVKNLLGFSELFDNAAWTKSNSFVQTNLLTYSEAFDNAAWTKAANTTVTANFALAPNGYQTADRLQLPATGLTSMFQAISLTSGVTYTFSVYVKATSSNSNFDLFQGTTQLGTQTATSNWQRFTYTFTSGTTGSVNIGINNGDDSYASDILIWGAQLVQGSVAGDYRRTDAAALPVYYPNHNGVVCAEKLVVDSAVGAKYIFQNTTQILNTPLTLSCYLKKAELQYAFLYNAQNNIGRVFNLNDGTSSGLAGITDPTSYSIIPIGDSWYRCSITYPAASGGNGSRIYALSTSSSLSVTGDGTSGIYIFGAQLSDSASLDPYVLNAGAAPTAAAYYGARFDYDPVTLAPKGLLIEEQRSNLLLQSDDFNNAYWTKNATTVTSDKVASPMSGVLADLITTSGSDSIVSTSTTITNGATYAESIYVKKGSFDWMKITAADASTGTNSARAWFNLTTGVKGSTTTTGTGWSVVSSSMTSVGNGWYRVTLTFVGAGTAHFISITTADADLSLTRAPSGSTYYIWGAQLEAGAFATSYIPTAASQVTRAADVATIQGSNFYSWWNANAGTLYSQSDGLGVILQACLSATPNSYSLRLKFGNPAMTIYDASTITASLGNMTANALTKIAGVYQINDAALSIAGGSVSTDTSTDVPLANNMYIGSRAGSDLFLNGTIKQINYYNTRLPNATLQGLTV